MIKCKACIAKDEHIKTLQKQIEDYRALAIPPKTDRILPIEMEQDAILSGRQEMIEISDEDFQRQEAINSEADRLLSGIY